MKSSFEGYTKERVICETTYGKVIYRLLVDLCYHVIIQNETTVTTEIGSHLITKYDLICDHNILSSVIVLISDYSNQVVVSM